MQPAPVVQPDSFLTLHYRIALASESAIDSAVVDTFEDKPATLQLGCGQLAPPLEARLIGLSEGERVSFELPPGEAYGERRPELVQRLSRRQLDAETQPGTELEPGDWIEFAAPPGAPQRRFAGVLRELDEQFALFDFNHPLAGQPIRFDVQIIGVL
jgi:FKBP-type peptidyl-prolyl cis-trans isomerase SlpA